MADAFARDRFTILPVLGIDHLLDARLEDGVEIFAHFNEDGFACTSIVTVEIDNGMASGAGAREEVNSGAVIHHRFIADGII